MIMPTAVCADGYREEVENDDGYPREQVLALVVENDALKAQIAALLAENNDLRAIATRLVEDV